MYHHRSSCIATHAQPPRGTYQQHAKNTKLEIHYLGHSRGRDGRAHTDQLLMHGRRFLAKLFVRQTPDHAHNLTCPSHPSRERHLTSQQPSTSVSRCPRLTHSRPAFAIRQCSTAFTEHDSTALPSLLYCPSRLPPSGPVRSSAFAQCRSTIDETRVSGEGSLLRESRTT